MLLVPGALACCDDVQQYLHERRLETHRTLSTSLWAAPAGTFRHARTSRRSLRSTTLIHGISVQAEDRASRAWLIATVDYAMAAWDSLTKP